MTTTRIRDLCRPASMIALCVVLVTACSERSPSTGGKEGGAPSPSSPGTTTTDVGTAATDLGVSPQITIAVGDRRITGTLDDSRASRDLLAQLPVTLRLSDHGSVEKTGPLPRQLSTEGSPAGADPDVADIGYYAPSNDFVLYYGDQGYYPGIVILGRMDASGPAVVGGVDGDVTVSVSRAGRTAL